MNLGDWIVGLFPIATMGLAALIAALAEYTAVEARIRDDWYGKQRGSFTLGTAIDPGLHWTTRLDAVRGPMVRVAAARVVALVLAIASGVAIGVTWAP